MLEKNTLLVISRFSSDADEGAGALAGGRFDTVCQLLKVFRLNCQCVSPRRWLALTSRRHVAHANFQALQLRTGGFSAVVDELTPNTYILVVSNTPGVEPGGLELMIRQNRDTFARVQAASWGRL